MLLLSSLPLLLPLPLLLLSQCCRCCEVVAGRQLDCRGARLLGLQRLPPPSANITSVELTGNGLSELPARAFGGFANLQGLLLGSNRLSQIHEDAFAGLEQLRVLDLDGNQLREVPRAVSKLGGLRELSLANNRIEALGADSFGAAARDLLSLDLRANPLRQLHELAFRRMTRLRKLELKTNRIAAVPDLSHCRDLRLLDLANNRISSLDGRPFEASGALRDLLLARNAIRRVPADAFVGLSRLQVLDLEGNLIDWLHPEAFGQLGQLQDLNLGNNAFPELPVAGLEGILHLKTFNNPALREFPGPERFPRARSMLLSYAYHCCAYVAEDGRGAARTLDDELDAGAARDAVLFPGDDDFDPSLWSSNLTDLWPQLNNMSGKFGTKLNELWNNFGTDFSYPGNLPAYVEEYFEDQEGGGGGAGEPQGRTVHCRPEPGPFLPCRDLFDWWTLRCGVWVVFLLAMLGNGTVVFVLLFSRGKMDVPRFLVCNLAAADFFMGLYLGALAVVDAATLGEFRKHAIPWQMSAGCRAAGFLGVLSSELSVFSLAVITLERNYAITHAMHLNKRLSLRRAYYIMALGWCFALTMAALPLFGVSDYRKFAICLPFETGTAWATAYVVLLMLVNGLAFFVLMGCYLRMYCAIRGSQAWNSNDSRIARRMALLVFTDFLCWSPIAFFSLTATFGLHLVSLEQAKVFAVFVLPLNSCCNPFLYAILTKQFKKDCVLICKAIEESRVTRGAARCRHGSHLGPRPAPSHPDSLVTAGADQPQSQPQQRRRQQRQREQQQQAAPPPPPPPPAPARRKPVDGAPQHQPGCPYGREARCWRAKLGCRVRAAAAATPTPTTRPLPPSPPPPPPRRSSAGSTSAPPPCPPARTARPRAPTPGASSSAACRCASSSRGGAPAAPRSPPPPG
ncbi:lutropin-choriogonadotropic hormone receptor-like isoform X2 [Phymastichus coffea]|uniref:lutropin-choriogonadotropic hormone receptor-like isoform X2 n=1 Tax=Phymastichus coffea TaxID=108790 RepID=UPI00273CE97C|nr:lutropin-choriogonadotropic hormone receptor-like isoform X2 [Phymastichus coffea]